MYIDINHCSHDLTVTRNHHMNKRVAWRVMFTSWVLELQALLYGLCTMGVNKSLVYHGSLHHSVHRHSNKIELHRLLLHGH